MRCACCHQGTLVPRVYRGDPVLSCTACGAKRVTYRQLDAHGGRSLRQALEALGPLTDQASPRGCPTCGERLRHLEGYAASRGLVLEDCPRCQNVWFDAGELRQLNQGRASAGPHATEEQREMLLELAPAEIEDSAPDPDDPGRRVRYIREDGSGLRTLLAFIGLPVETRLPERLRTPWMTGCLILGLSACFLHTLGNPAMAKQLAFVPALPWRHYGITWVTCFLLHGGWLHLLGNLYFLWLFGDNVEDWIGRRRYAGLLLLATLGGSFADWATRGLWLHLHPEVPLSLEQLLLVPAVGASGGIAGVLCFYSLQFPTARIGLAPGILRWFLWRWLPEFPVWLYFLGWIGLQVFGFTHGGFGVNYAAHLGGALAGVFCWGLWGRQRVGG